MTGKNDSLLKIKLFYGPLEFLFSLFTETEKLLKFTFAKFTDRLNFYFHFLRTLRNCYNSLWHFLRESEK